MELISCSSGITFYHYIFLKLYSNIQNPISWLMFRVETKNQSLKYSFLLLLLIRSFFLNFFSSNCIDY